MLYHQKYYIKIAKYVKKTFVSLIFESDNNVRNSYEKWRALIQFKNIFCRPPFYLMRNVNHIKYCRKVCKLNFYYIERLANLIKIS